jgi:hypothetical protein
MLKRSKVKRVVHYTNSNEKVQQNARKQAGEAKLFDEIWDERPHFSFISGLPIFIQPHTAFWYNCFGHVLSKAINKYPKYKLYKKNIVLLLPDEHLLYDMGSTYDRDRYHDKLAVHGVFCDWNKLFELKEQLKKQYPNIH